MFCKHDVATLLASYQLLQISIFPLFLNNASQVFVGSKDVFVQHLTISILSEESAGWYIAQRFDICNSIQNHVQVNIEKKLSELNSTPPEIIRKLTVFWWFQGEEKLIHSLKFAHRSEIWRWYLRWKSKTRVTSSNPRVTSSNSRVRRIKARVSKLKARVGRLNKARVRKLKHELKQWNHELYSKHTS